MKCVVTGAAGFIGSHLCKALLDEGSEVVGIDRLSNYYSPKIKMMNIRELQEDGLTFIHADLATSDLTQFLEDADIVFHLAAQPGVRGSWGPSFRVYVKDNILATQRLLEAMSASQTRKLVFASSSSIYGESESYPTNEDTPPRPISPYGVTKLCAENLCRVYSQSHGIKTIILRYFSIYGPKQRPDMAIYRFIDAVLRGRKIEVYGSGEQERDFTYISDAVQATLRAARIDRNFEIINIGRGRPVKLKEIIETITKISGRRAEVEYKEEQRGDVKKTYADISKAREILGYEPQVDIDKGIELQYVWQRSISRRRA
jgi:nucleoside-diphosphate-sugar epimerase